MNSEFSKRQSSFLFQIAIVSVLLYGVHYYILYHFAKDVTFFFPLWQVYTFQIIVTVLIYTIINYIYASGKKDILKFFLLATLLKMVLAVVFLLPMILSKTFDNKQADVFNFFIPYFIYLFIEVFSIAKFLQKN